MTLSHLSSTAVIALLAAMPAAHAANFQVLYDFQAANALYPNYAPLARDGAGALYGIAGRGQKAVLFQLRPPAVNGTTWRYAVLYHFNVPTDQPSEFAGVTVGPAGVLYGTTAGGVFQLSPPAPGTATWYQSLYRFTAADGVVHTPSSAPALGADGALYGSINNGGAAGWGMIYRLAPAAGGWTESIVHSFAYDGGGASPIGPLVINSSGAMFGSTRNAGANGHGNVYRLGAATPAQTVGGQTLWAFADIYDVPKHTSDGPLWGVSIDATGALYGSYAPAHGGQAFSLTPPPVGPTPWTATLLGHCGGGAGPALPLAGGGVMMVGVASICTVTPGTGGTWVTTLAHRFANGVQNGALLAGPGGTFYGLNVDFGPPGHTGQVYAITP